jgi:hypothetical protein
VKKIVLLIISFAMMITGTCFGFQNEPDGFRGIPWGASFDQYKDQLTFAFTDTSYGGIDFYTKNNDDLSIGSAQANKIVYGFWQGKLTDAYIYTKGYNNFTGVFDALKQKFGYPYQPNEYINRYWWNGNKTSIMAELNDITDDGSIWFESQVYSNQQKAWDKQKAQEGAQKGF